MKHKYVDLHVHSYFSDGSLSPEELAFEADKNGVGLLALADHDVTEGNTRLRSACAGYGIQTISAVEIDAIDGDNNVHILAYGFDERDAVFADFLSHTRFMLDESGVRLVDLMSVDYKSFSVADYMDFTYDRSLGGWKALHYLMEKGITATLKEGVRYYARYGMKYEQAGYPTIAAVAYRIKAAGGVSVLAHPGVVIGTDDIGSFTKELNRMIGYGLDGLECYYPTHTDEVTQACLRYCTDNGLMITAGSDCHGVFGNARVGQTKTTPARLALGNLY